MWRARFGRGFGPVVRQTTKRMNEHDVFFDNTYGFWTTNVCVFMCVRALQHCFSSNIKVILLLMSTQKLSFRYICSSNQFSFRYISFSIIRAAIQLRHQLLTSQSIFGKSVISLCGLLRSWTSTRSRRVQVLSRLQPVDLLLQTFSGNWKFSCLEVGRRETFVWIYDDTCCSSNKSTN